jgi:hypothetical protein
MDTPQINYKIIEEEKRKYGFYFELFSGNNKLERKNLR